MARCASKDEMQNIIKRFKHISTDKKDILNIGTDLHVLTKEDIEYICKKETSFYAAQRRLHQRTMDF